MIIDPQGHVVEDWETSCQRCGWEKPVVEAVEEKKVVNDEEVSAEMTVEEAIKKAPKKKVVKKKK